MADNNELQDQYGAEDDENMLTPISLGIPEKEKKSEISIVSTKEVLVKDQKGINSTVPTMAYIRQLENKITKLGADNTALRGAIGQAQKEFNALNKRLSLVEAAVKWVADRS